MSTIALNSNQPPAEPFLNGQTQERAELNPLSDFQRYAIQYAKQEPEVCALGCLFVGFVLGWKLKPW